MLLRALCACVAQLFTVYFVHPSSLAQVLFAATQHPDVQSYVDVIPIPPTMYANANNKSSHTSSSLAFSRGTSESGTASGNNRATANPSAARPHNRVRSSPPPGTEVISLDDDDKSAGGSRAVGSYASWGGLWHRLKE